MTLATGRDLALIYFIVISFVAALVPLVAFGAAVYGLRLGRRRMMPYIHLAQFYAARIARGTSRGSERITRPFILAEGVVGRISTFASHLAGKFGL